MNKKWIKIASVEELKELLKDKDIVIIDIEEENKTISIMIIYKNSKFYALENRCSHDNAEFNIEHVTENKIIQCPRHGARFDIETGKALTMPAKSPIKKFDLKIEDALLYITLI